MRTATIALVLVSCFARAADKADAVRAKLDPPDRAGRKPFSPAIGQTVAVTPPPLIWAPYGRGKTVYAVQVSRAKNFPADKTQTWEDLAVTVFVPRKPLASGQWFWRYGVKAGDGYVYGKARPFTVPSGAREFPFPDFDQVLARVPKAHPRLFFPGERLAAARKLAAGPLKKQMAGLRRSLERRAIGKPIVPEPPRPRTGPERVTVMRTTRPPMDDMERCALVYLLTGDKPCGLEAKRRLLHFFSWDPNGPTGLWGYDEPAMWMMMRGTRAYDWTRDLFTDAERAKIEPVMKVRARQFYVHLRDKRKFHTNPYESHAGRMPGFLGEACLVFAHEWPEAREWMEYATLLYYTSYPAWGGDDGGWQEGPSYWGAYMRFALHYVVALKYATGVDLMGKPFFRHTPYHALYCATPYFERTYYGDGHTSSPRYLSDVMYTFASLLDDPHLMWFPFAAGRGVGGDLLTLATYKPDLEPEAPTDLPAARVFPGAGLAGIHSAPGESDEDVALVFRSSPMGSVSHGHADQNSFVIDAYGRGLAITTGYYPWYGSPHHHNWTRATRSVNSILVDGQGQIRRRWDAAGRITAFHTDPLGEKGYDYVEGEAGGAYGGTLTQFRRHILHARPGVFVICDDLAAPKPATFQWLLHACDKIEVKGSTLHVRRPPAEMNVHLLAPAGLKISQNDRYDPPPEGHEHKRATYRNTWHLTAETTKAARRGRFLTVFAVGMTGQTPPLKRVALRTGKAGKAGKGSVGVHLVWTDGRTDDIDFPAPGQVRAEGRSAEARVIRRFIRE